MLFALAAASRRPQAASPPVVQAVPVGPLGGEGSNGGGGWLYARTLRSGQALPALCLECPAWAGPAGGEPLPRGTLALQRLLVGEGHGPEVLLALQESTAQDKQTNANQRLWVGWDEALRRIYSQVSGERDKR